MKKVLFVFITTLSTIVWSHPADRLRFKLELWHPPVKDPVSCRLYLTIQDGGGFVCYSSDVFRGIDEDCDFYYDINDVEVEGKSWISRGYKLISNEDALKLLKTSELPKECR